MGVGEGEGEGEAVGEAEGVGEGAEEEGANSSVAVTAYRIGDKVSISEDAQPVAPIRKQTARAVAAVLRKRFMKHSVLS